MEGHPPDNQIIFFPTFDQLLSQRKKTSKFKFTPELDRLLLMFYKHYNGDWKRIANALSKPAGKIVTDRQVYDRYNYYLKGGINLNPLTEEEWSIIERYKTPPISLRFDAIAKYLGNGRTAKFLKNEWNKRQQHKINPNMKTRKRERIITE